VKLANRLNEKQTRLLGIKTKWTSAPISDHLSSSWKCTASQIETSICTNRTTHHWWQQLTRGALSGSPIEC